MANTSERIKAGNRASIFGIICNILLAAAKLIIGLTTGMISIVADSVNNFSDAVASIVSLIGFVMSSRPADDEHPFGHARYEYISGLVVSFLVMMAGVELLKNSVEKIITPKEINISVEAFVVLLLSIAIKFLMAAVYRRVGKRIDSETIKAASVDSRNDCIATAAVFAGALLMVFFKVNLDGYIGALVSVFVLFSGYSLVKDTIMPLLGTTPDKEFINHIQEKILSYDGVLGAHDLMIHDYGPGHCFASVHVEVPAEDSVLKCHDLVDRIEQDFKNEENINLVIHYDPVISSGKKATPEIELQNYLISEARNAGYNISIHDLKIADNTNVFFDCVISSDDRDHEHEIIDFLLGKIKEKSPNYSGTVKIDHGFVSLG